MRTVTTKQAADDYYFDLIKVYPLRPIHSEREFDRAMEVLIRLVKSKPEEEMDAGERDYIEALEVLAQRFEQGRRDSILPRLAPRERLKFLMDQRGMTVNNLGRVIGSQPGASLILHGKRSMSKTQILKLAKFFAVSPALFIE
jgi:HTH-type transcriptional regulator/antitoxin HigA